MIKRLLKRFCRRWAEWVVYDKQSAPATDIEAYVDGEPKGTIMTVDTYSQLRFWNWVYDVRRDTSIEFQDPPPVGAFVVIRYKVSTGDD